MRRIAFVPVAAASMVSVVGYTAHPAKQANGQAGPGDLSVFVNGRSSGRIYPDRNSSTFWFSRDPPTTVDDYARESWHECEVCDGPSEAAIILTRCGGVLSPATRLA